MKSICFSHQIQKVKLPEKKLFRIYSISDDWYCLVQSSSSWTTPNLIILDDMIQTVFSKRAQYLLLPTGKHGVQMAQASQSWVGLLFLWMDAQDVNVAGTDLWLLGLQRGHQRTFKPHGCTCLVTLKLTIPFSALCVFQWLLGSLIHILQVDASDSEKNL